MPAKFASPVTGALDMPMKRAGLVDEGDVSEFLVRSRQASPRPGCGFGLDVLDVTQGTPRVAAATIADEASRNRNRGAIVYWGFHLVSTASSVRKQWQWQECEDAGAVVESSAETFGTLSDCMRDAREHGYWGSGGVLAEL